MHSPFMSKEVKTPRKVLILQNVGTEGPGTIVRALREAGIHWDLVKAYAGEFIPSSLDGYSALIVLGGPMGAYEDDKFPYLLKEIRLIESVLREGYPMLGICLGSQLIAKAAGARVYKGSTKEIGWYKVSLTEEGVRDGLTATLPHDQMVFQWHGDSFDLPTGGTLLATSKDYPNQLVRLGRSAYAMQFHLEVTEEMVRQWLEVGAAEVKEFGGAQLATSIIKDTEKYIGELTRLGSQVFSRFLRDIQVP